MLKTLYALLVTLSATLPAVLSGQAVEFSFDSAVMNKYIWRGIVFGGESVMQPSVTAGFGHFSANLWGNVNLSDGRNYDLTLNEVDYAVDYSNELGSLGYSAGAIYYTFPNIGGGETTEIYAGLSLSSVLNPSVMLYQDVQDVEGTYVLLGVAPSIPLDAWSSSLDIALSLGLGSGKHNSFYYGSSGGGVTDFMLGLSMPFKLSDRASLAPSISFINLVDSDIRAAQPSDGNILVGLSFSTSF